MFSQINVYAELSDMINRSLKDRELLEVEQKRLEYELSIIKQTDTAFAYLFALNALKSFSNEEYCFLGKENNCFINYLLGLTHINPVRYDLPFEMFFNYERNSMPIFRFNIKKGAKARLFNNICGHYGVKRFVKGYDFDDAYFFDTNDLIFDLKEHEIGQKTFCEVLPGVSASELFCKGFFEFDISEFDKNDIVERNFSDEEIYNKAIALTNDLTLSEPFKGIAYIERMLKATDGRLVFQEQVVNILHMCCGFGVANADNVRRALCRKKTNYSNEVKEILFNKYGKVGENFFEYLLKYAKYTVSKGWALARLYNNIGEEPFN